MIANNRRIEHVSVSPLRPKEYSARKHFVTICLLTNLFLPIALASEPSNFQTETSAIANVSGTVTNASDGSPIGGARVTLKPAEYSSNTAKVVTAITTKDGIFAFSSVPAMAYFVLCDADGYISDDFSLLPRSIDIHEANSRLDIVLSHGATIRGKITDIASDAKSTDVVAYRESYQNGRPTLSVAGEVKSDPSGSYRFSGLTPGKYRLIAGYNKSHIDSHDKVTKSFSLVPSAAPIPTWYPSAPAIIDAAVIDVLSNDNIADADIAIRTAPTILLSGFVERLDQATDSLFLTIAPTLAGFDTSLLSQPVRIQRGGSFEISNLPTGEYDLTLSELRATSQVRDKITIVVGHKDIRGLILSSARTMHLKGRILIDSGETSILRDMRVSLSDISENIQAIRENESAKVANDGSFELENVGPKSYLVKVLMPDSYYIDDIQYEGIHIEGHTVDLGISPSGDLRIVLKKDGAQIDGEVTVDPMEQHNIDILAGEAILMSKSTQSDTFQIIRTPLTRGRFYFTRLKPGDYSIALLQRYDPALWSTPSFVAAISRQSLTVSLSGGHTSRVRASLMSHKAIVAAAIAAGLASY